MQRSVSEIALQVAAKITWHPLKRSYIHINQGSFSCNLRRYFPHSYLESGRRKILHLHHPLLKVTLYDENTDFIIFYIFIDLYSGAGDLSIAASFFQKY